MFCKVRDVKNSCEFFSFVFCVRQLLEHDIVRQPCRMWDNNPLKSADPTVSHPTHLRALASLGPGHYNFDDSLQLRCSCSWSAYRVHNIHHVLDIDGSRLCSCVSRNQWPAPIPHVTAITPQWTGMERSWSARSIVSASQELSHNIGGCLKKSTKQ